MMTAASLQVVDPEKPAAPDCTPLPHSGFQTAFDHLTRLAAKTLRAPVALISLLEDDWQRLESCVGLPAPMTAGWKIPLPCSSRWHLRSAEPLIVEDVRRHSVIHEKLVIPDPRAVAFAGIPLTSRSGDALGSLCVIDYEPRHWTADEVTMLKDLAALALIEIESRQALAAAERQKQDAQTAVWMRDRVLAIVAHDLRNPLHTIGMSTSFLQESALSEEQRHQLGIVQRAAGRMERLIRDLLDVARLEAGRTLAIEQHPQRLAPLIVAACEAVRVQVEHRRLYLTHEVPDDLPQVRVDADRILQVLLNLLGNAIKFTPERGQIEIRAERCGDEVQIAVADTGPGIRQEDMEHLFDPFWQAERTARLGAGLGLSIVKGIVEAHGGRVWATSKLASGTTLSFTIPVA